MTDSISLNKPINRFDSSIFICPICQSRLISEKPGQLYCSNKDCVKSQEEFIFVNGKPVLIDFSKSVVPASAFTLNIGKSIVQRRKASLGRILRILFQGKNPVTKANVNFLIESMKSIPDPRIFVVGGGEIGSGLEEFYALFHDNIISFDIYDSEAIDFVADGHLIPIRSGYFDLVIVQAVLEHVLNPYQVVSEITRILKKDGIVYAETPFMQQVHEGPFDFTRFTESGHRYLFKEYRLISSGHTSGAGTALIWSLSAFFTGLFRSKSGGKIARILFFWLRFFDRVIPVPYNIDAACGVFFIGQKTNITVSDLEVIAHYGGSQQIR